MSAFDEPAIRLDLSTVEAGALAVALWRRRGAEPLEWQATDEGRVLVGILDRVEALWTDTVRRQLDEIEQEEAGACASQ